MAGPVPVCAYDFGVLFPRAQLDCHQERLLSTVLARLLVGQLVALNVAKFIITRACILLNSQSKQCVAITLLFPGTN